LSQACHNRILAIQATANGFAFEVERISEDDTRITYELTIVDPSYDSIGPATYDWTFTEFDGTDVIAAGQTVQYATLRDQPFTISIDRTRDAQVDNLTLRERGNDLDRPGTDGIPGTAFVFDRRGSRRAEPHAGLAIQHSSRGAGRKVRQRDHPSRSGARVGSDRGRRVRIPGSTARASRLRIAFLGRTWTILRWHARMLHRPARATHWRVRFLPCHAPMPGWHARLSGWRARMLRSPARVKRAISTGNHGT